jgi:hypothetical protein
MTSKADTSVARTIGIDTGKNTLHVIGPDEKGAIVLREKVSRTRIAARFVNVPPCSMIFGRLNHTALRFIPQGDTRGRYLTLPSWTPSPRILFSVVKELDHERHLGCLNEATEASTALGD